MKGQIELVALLPNRKTQMKAKDKAKELEAFMERLRVTFDLLDGREGAKLLGQLDGAIRRMMAFKQAIEERRRANDPVEAMERLLPLL